MRPLTIGFVFDDSLDSTDGVQQHILTLGQELRRRSHQVHYLVGQTSHPPVINVHPLSRNVLVSFNGNQMRIPLLASDQAIEAVLQAHHFDILHIQAPYSPLLAGRVISKADADTGLVATYHIAPTGPAQLLAGQFLGALNAGTHRRIDEVIAVSQVAAQYAHVTAGAKGVVIANPVDVKQLVARRQSAGQAQIQAFKGKGPHIVFLGRFVKRKGALLFVKALACGQRAGLFPSDLHVTMAGKGPLLERCQQETQGLSIPVDFPGYVSEEMKPALLASADLAVFPSTGGESFGIVLLEALASGAGLVLAGDNPGYRSTLAGLDDALVPVRGSDNLTASALAQRMARALVEAQWARAVGQQERELLKRYDVTQVADQVEAVYAEALASRRRS